MLLNADLNIMINKKRKKRVDIARTPNNFCEFFLFFLHIKSVTQSYSISRLRAWKDKNPVQNI